MLPTDGFYEWENEQRDQFGLERVADVVRLNAGVPAGELIRRLHQAVSAHAGSVKQVDDLTVMVVQADCLLIDDSQIAPRFGAVEMRSCSRGPNCGNYDNPSVTTRSRVQD